MRRLLLYTLSAVVLLGAMASPLPAQEQNIYAHLTNWDISRAHRGDFVAYVEKNLQPVLEKLFEEGEIIEWGLDASTLHTEDGYSHGLWWTATSIGNVEDVLDAFDEAASGLSEQERAKRDREFASYIKKHSDSLVRSEVFRSRTTTTDEGYVSVSSVLVKPGKGQDYAKWWDKYRRPAFEGLYQEGTILSYGMDVQYYHTADPGLRTAWYVVPNTEALDKVEAALRSAAGTRTPEEREAIANARRDITVQGGHSDSLSRIIHYAVKEVNKRPST